MPIDFWTEAEDDALRAATAAGVDAACAAVPHRSRRGVLKRAERLGIAIRARKLSAWMTSEERILRHLWPAGKKEVIQCALPGRSWCAIELHAQKIGLYRNVTAKRPYAVPEHHLMAILKERLETKGLTAGEIYRRVGVKAKILRGWFCHYHDPRLTTFERAVKAAGGKIIIVWDDAT